MIASKASTALRWNTFDGSDVVDGGPGTDSLFFQSGNSDGTADGYDSDTISVLQNGAGFALYRDRGNVSMDVQNTEVLLLTQSVDFAARFTMHGDPAPRARRRRQVRPRAYRC